MILTSIGIMGASQLEPTFDFRDFLPDGVEASEAAKSVVTDFDFSSEEGYVLAEGDVSDPAVFLALDLVQQRALERENVVASEPISSPLEMGRRLSDPAFPTFDPEFNVIWHMNVDRNFDGSIDGDITRDNVTAVYDGLFISDPDQAGRVLKRDGNGGYTGLVIRIPVNSRAGERSGSVTNDIKYASEPMEDLEGSSLDKATATGGPLVNKVILDEISSSQAQSLMITFLVSLFILTVIFFFTRRTLLLGLITLLPLVFVIAGFLAYLAAFVLWLSKASGANQI